MARLKLVDARVDRQGRGDVAVTRVREDRLGAQWPQNPAGLERLQLRGEIETAPHLSVVERLHTEAIPGENECTALPVPQRNREHAGEWMQEVGAVVLV